MDNNVEDLIMGLDGENCGPVIFDINAVGDLLHGLQDTPRAIPGRVETCMSDFVFRGQADVDFELLPSIARIRSRECFGKEVAIDPGDLTMEGDFIEAACQRLPHVFNSSLRPIDLLARLQHYGVPTRMLDVTKNALAALYFACTGSDDKDGEVIVFRHPNYDRRDYPVSQAIADSWRLLPIALSFDEFIDIAFQQPYFTYQRHQFGDTRAQRDSPGEWLHSYCVSPMFVNGSASLGRQVSQAGTFILFPNASSYVESCIPPKCSGWWFRHAIEPLSKEGESVAARGIVKAQSKRSILRELRTLGVTRATLFPDSVDIVCRDIVDDVRSTSGQGIIW